MQFKDSGKRKAITFSFDDGVTQDIQMIRLLDKYGLKATFHLCSGWLGKMALSYGGGCMTPRYKIAEKHLQEVYGEHEVASHTINHLSLPDQTDEEVIRQVEEDRQKLSEIVGYEVVGLAYPGDPVDRENCDQRVIDLVRKHTGIQYARTAGRGYRGWDLPTDLYKIRPNMSMRGFDENMEIAERFLEASPEKPQVLMLMGHCYEMDFQSDHWYRMEQLFEKLSKQDDIFYGTNREVFL
jgi:peptidoglycan/xylan/chitin deacetylase (PgdA/CDA1 family)